MSAELISNENNQAKFKLTLGWDDFSEATNKVYRKNRSRFNVPGFRRGKAPKGIVESYYGKNIFYEDALNDLLPGLLKDSMDELALEGIGYPDVDLTKMEEGQPIEIEVQTELMPHPTLGDYSQIEVARLDTAVSEEAVDDYIERERQQNAVISPVEGAAVEGNLAKIDFVGEVDGQPFDGGSAEDVDLTLGEGQFIPGFEEQIAGHKAGESFDIQVTFPEDYQEEKLAGQDAVFHIDLKEVKQKELPELDDDFAQDVSEYDSLAEYRQSVREKLEEEDREQKENIQKMEAVSKLVEISGIEAPKALVEDEMEQELQNQANQLAQFGIRLSDYLQYSHKTVEEMKEELRPEAEERVKGNLALRSLVEAENIEVSEEEVNQEIQKLGEQYGAKDLEDFARRVKEAGNDKSVAQSLKQEKALDFLMTKVQYVDPQPEEAASEEEGDEEGLKPEEADQN